MRANYKKKKEFFLLLYDNRNDYKTYASMQQIKLRSP